MNVTITKQNLLHALTIGGGASGKNKVVPVFELLKCKVNDKLTISSHDGESGMRCAVDYVEADDHFSFFVNAKDFIGVIKSIKNGNITLSTDSSTTLLINYEKGVIQLPLVNTVPLPQFEKEGDSQKCTIPSAKLTEWIKIAQNFVAQDELRPIMQGLMINVEPNLCKVCATNAHKLFADDFTLYGNECSFKAVIPQKNFLAIVSVLATCEDATIINYGKHIEIVGDDCAITCRKIEGTFPNYEAVIPNIEQREGLFSVSKNEFIDSVKRCGGIADTKTYCLSLDMINGKLHLASKCNTFERFADEYLDVESSGDIKVALKADCLSACLSSVVGDDVDVYVFGPSRAIVIKDKERAGKTILQMPIFLN